MAKKNNFWLFLGFLGGALSRIFEIFKNEYPNLSQHLIPVQMSTGPRGSDKKLEKVVTLVETSVPYRSPGVASAAVLILMRVSARRAVQAPPATELSTDHRAVPSHHRAGAVPSRRRKDSFSVPERMQGGVH